MTHIISARGRALLTVPGKPEADEAIEKLGNAFGKLHSKEWKEPTDKERRERKERARAAKARG